MAILNAYSGHAPWAKQQKRADRRAGFQWQGAYGERKLGRGVNAERVKYVTGGWTVVSPDQIYKQPDKTKMVRMQLYYGASSYVPAGDVDALAQYHHIPPEAVMPQMAEEAAKAFSEEYAPANKKRGAYEEWPGAGHIKGIRYSPLFQIMEVTFTKKGNSVTFFRVTQSVAQSLHLAGDAMAIGFDGKHRHLMGIRFWNLVRVRGTIHSVRYDAVDGTADSLEGDTNYESNWAAHIEKERRMAGDQVAAIEEGVGPSHPVAPDPQATKKAGSENNAVIEEALKSNKIPDGFKANMVKYRDRFISKGYGGSPDHYKFAELVEEAMRTGDISRVRTFVFSKNYLWSD